MEYGKKITLTKKEVNDLNLGKIHSEKQTESYKRAQSFFKRECEELTKKGGRLSLRTHIWFDNKENAFKMRFAITHQDTKSLNELHAEFLKMTNHIFRKH